MAALPTVAFFAMAVMLAVCGARANKFSSSAGARVLLDEASFINGEIGKMTRNLTNQMAKELDFCILNIDEENNRAFNFSNNMDFINACLLETEGDMVQRLCSLAELKYYFQRYLLTSGKPTGLNKNCNAKSWNSGCEPGWASALTVPTTNGYDQNSRTIPARTANPAPCCDGFFCPRGLTCMIPCPLGAYCPKAVLNATTGNCDPYSYTLPYSETNHSCGGADLWADIRRTKQIFCSAGFYCPTNTLKESCSSGHYCRLGSTSQSGCYPLIPCGTETVNQPIFTYGIFLIVTVLALLLLVYTCSDQLLDIRERRRAKSRQAAAISAREKIKAHERWRLVREAAKAGVTKLQGPLQHTFSKKQYSENIEEQEMLGTPGRILSDQVPVRPLQPVIGSGESYEFDHESVAILNEIKIASNLDGGSSKEKKSKTSLPNSAHRRYVFEYAYSEIEKEKLKQNSRMTFTELIQEASACEASARTRIEVTFRDLNLTLKGNGKRLLKNVTGELMSGHITAVMGPSGAGKTSFLNAIAGKLSGCVLTGSVLINGKPNSAHSYKKIVGFVPQDDIIHGNLTVEENLWFSARCRLPSNMQKARRVLVIERVIEALGLQSVRDSLVGTVEKRGISGGQRKRVNVGIELVIQPSLLFLDEPTSGLDSSSSILLLKALRREALEGANICTVLHQPSFGLFRMFDDLKLFAKEGRMVYDGSIDEVEQYFSTLGIFVPDRINPPDYFMDILEGITKPGRSGHFDCSILPIKWMEHKGYDVPVELRDSYLQTHREITGRAREQGSNNQIVDKQNQSFMEDLKGEMCLSFLLKWDDLMGIFFTVEDLSGRQTPTFFNQLRFYLGRVAKQRFRESNLQAKDYLILMLGGACLGMLTNGQDESFDLNGHIYTLIALPLLCMVSALRTFSSDKLQYWRESAAGMSRLAYFLAKDTIDLFNTAIKPVLYLSSFYFLCNPRSSFADNYLVTLVLTYCVVGLAYILAITLDSAPAQLCSALLPVVFTLVATQGISHAFLRNFINLTYSKWALEAYAIANVKRYSGVWLISRCGYLFGNGYDLNNWARCLVILVGCGIIFRMVAFVCLVTLNRKIQG